MTIEYAERYVAYLDILGFSEMVSAKKPEEVIALLNGLLKRALSCANDFKQDGLSYRLFSDCVCVSTPLNYDGLDSILGYVAFFQTIAYMDGIFMRGGLSIGKHYETPKMIFSKGLVNAFRLEKKAFYPRVLVDDCVLEAIEVIDADSDMLAEKILSAPDGLAFVDYLFLISYEAHLKNHKQQMLNHLQIHKQQILNQLNDHGSDPNIVAKYMWLADYHNATCRRLNTEAWRELLIDTLELPGFNGVKNT